jgi:hypothetical protein
LTIALAELSRERATRHLPLSGLTEAGLTEAGVARLIREITGVIPRESVVAAVCRHTEGSPLFVGEAVRLLAAAGRLERGAAFLTWRSPSAQVPVDDASERPGRRWQNPA